MGPGIDDPRENAGAKRNGKGNGYEFQMLLGVRGPMRRKLAAEGHRTRVYVPYGAKWYEKFFTSYHINSQILLIKNSIIFFFFSFHN